jgi:hypothetical protein
MNFKPKIFMLLRKKNLLFMFFLFICDMTEKYKLIQAYIFMINIEKKALKRLTKSLLHKI